MDIQAIQRLMNVFGAPQAQGGIDTSNMGMPQLFPPMAPQSNELPDDTGSNLMNQYTPQRTASDALRTSLQGMPQRPVPGRLANLGAAIAGLGAGTSAQGIAMGQPIGFKFDPKQADVASDKIKYGDYDNQLADWKTQISALTGAANEEDRSNAGEVKRLYGEAQNEIKTKNLGILQEKNNIAREKSRGQYEAAKAKHLDNMARLNAEVKKWADDIRVRGANVENQGKHMRAMDAWHQERLAEQKDEYDYKLNEQEREFNLNKEMQKYTVDNPRGATDRETVSELLDANGNVTSDRDKAVGRRSVTRPIKKSNVIQDPVSKQFYDTSSWSAQDKAAAAAKGWK